MELICLYILVYDYVKTTTVLEDLSQHFITYIIRENWPYLIVNH